MKKFLCAIALFMLLVFLVSCSQSGSVTDEYSEGYADGYLDAKALFSEEPGGSYSDWDMEEEYWRGYEDGKSEAEYHHEVYDQIQDALRYPIDDAPMSAYEAAQIVGVVHGFMASDPSDDTPTHQEYQEAVESLYYFYEYFELERYDRYK